ncbi:MAG: hypothetical protein A2Z88_02980 [Omnitrophica WOR_2 bacterium GWA2_47_8]|nr:MAG: hypothetical protein A2Z88_02980 [Omnitrophica WOR_2 bacterium GWA2_47_8]
MPADISFNFNWIDILIACIFARVVLVGLRSNLVTEVFRVIGTFTAIFVILHYYVSFGETLNEYVFIPEMIQEPLAFVILWLTVALIFKLVGDGWTLMLRVQAHPVIDRWFGVFTGILRGFLVCSLTLVFFMVVDNEYLAKSTRRSFSGVYFIDVAPRIYHFVYDQVVSKYFPSEKLNLKVFDLRNVGEKKKDQT